MNIASQKAYEDVVRGVVGKIEGIIGPVAVKQAESVENLSVKPAVSIDGDPIKVIDRLLDKYTLLIGPVALTIARAGIREILEKNPKMKLPARLKVK